MLVGIGEIILAKLNIWDWLDFSIHVVLLVGMDYIRFY